MGSAAQAAGTPCVSEACDGGRMDGSLPIVKIILIILFGLMQGVNASKGAQGSHYELRGQPCKASTQTRSFDYPIRNYVRCQ